MANREIRRRQHKTQVKSNIASANKPPRNTNNSRKHWAWSVVSLLLLVCAGFAATTQGTTQQSVSSRSAPSQADAKSAVQPVSHVVTRNASRSLDDEEVDPATWRSIDLVMTKPDGGKLEMGLLRPLWWIAEVGAEEGKTIQLSIPEMSVEGPTKVLSIKPMQPMKSKPKEGLSVVTGTFKHSASNVLDLQLEAEDKPIGVTYSHPFRSADRKDWVVAGELKKGERVVTRTGTTKVVSIKKRPGQVPVYNLEVHKQHTYFVGKSGAWVHNSCVRRVGTAREGVTEVPLNQLAPLHPVPRPGMPDNHIDDLMDSMLRNGYDMSQAIPIARLPDGRLVSLGGHHRAEAMRRLGDETIPGRIVDWNSLSPEVRARWMERFPDFPW